MPSSPLLQNRSSTRTTLVRPFGGGKGNSSLRHKSSRQQQTNCNYNNNNDDDGNGNNSSEARTAAAAILMINLNDDNKTKMAEVHMERARSVEKLVTCERRPIEAPARSANRRLLLCDATFSSLVTNSILNLRPKNNKQTNNRIVNLAKCSLLSRGETHKFANSHKHTQNHTEFKLCVLAFTSIVSVLCQFAFVSKWTKSNKAFPIGPAQINSPFSTSSREMGSRAAFRCSSLSILSSFIALRILICSRFTSFLM